MAPVAAVLAGLVAQNLGAAFAKQLFPVVGVQGAVALRVGLAALIVCAMFRPWRTSRSRQAWLGVVVYGLNLGLMNSLIYMAFARIPIGIAVAIEVMGPLAVTLAASRRPRDAVPALLALAGVAMLAPALGGQALDPIGVLLAALAAATWAAYILAGGRVAAEGGGGQGVALGLVVAAVLTTPLGWADLSRASLGPEILLWGLALAALSSAAPYTLEMFALRRLPAAAFGLLASTAPAVAALMAFLTLGERLAPTQWLAVVMICSACALGTWGARRRET